MLNNVTLSGRICDNVRKHEFKNGGFVVNFTIAQSKKKGDEWETTYFDCSAWDRTAEFFLDYFGPGKAAIVEGSLSVKDSEKGRFWSINVNRLHFPPTDKEEQQGQSKRGYNNTRERRERTR